MLDKAKVQKRIDSLDRQENALIKAIHDWCPWQPARKRLAARLEQVQAQRAALEWAMGDYTWPSGRSEAETKRIIREEYDNA